ncbi:Ribosomal RNA-processing protein, partial [Lachnellula suecica]
MADSSLQDRLREHAEAFDGLLSLIPAKHYYGKDNSEQWKKKKQTKQEAAAAKRAKLDPDSEATKTAKDVMDERARKRKLEEMDESDIEGVEKEQPMQGMKPPQENKNKKQKVSNNPDGSKLPGEKPESAEATKLTVGEKRRLKQERKKEKKQKKEQKKEKTPKDGPRPADSPENKPAEEELVNGEEVEDGVETDEEELPEGEIGHFEAEGLEENPDTQNSSISPSPAPPSPTFDNPTGPSASTSTSSVIPPATAPKHIKLPTNPELLKARLTARLDALRAARKADKPDGTPARNREELLESRRKKEEQRKAVKKELRRKAKIEEDARREAALASARNSPASGMMSPSIHSPPHNFSFGRVAFADGQQLADDLSSLQVAPKKKGPQDAAGALAATEKKRQRLAGYDDAKRADIEDKELWANAKKRAHGVRVRDDTSLLKKTLKRKEKAKQKSEGEWKERKEGVAKAQAMKQKKREENIRKRKDEKGTKGKGKGKAAGRRVSRRVDR